MEDPKQDQEDPNTDGDSPEGEVQSVLGQWALRYVSLGWYVLPLYEIDPVTRVCRCSSQQGCSPGKHPRTSRGEKDASNDPGVVEAWWRSYPDANIGVATGPSDLLVIDIDSSEAHTAFFNWAAGFGVDLGSLATVHSHTGGNGLHIVFGRHGEEVKSTAGFLEHCDIRGSTGYIVVAPSLHKSGSLYQWIISPFDMAPAAAPQDLIARLRLARGTSNGGGTGGGYEFKAAVDNGPRAGHRDHFFNAYAYKLRKADMDVISALREMRRVWELCEQPPGDEYTWDSVLFKVKRVYDEIADDQGTSPDLISEIPHP